MVDIENLFNRFMTALSNYFDLDNQSSNDTFNVREFIHNLVTDNRGSITENGLEQMMMYVGVFLGVIFSAALTQYQKTGMITLNLSTDSVLGSFIIAFLILPIIYKNLVKEKKSPTIIRFALCVQNGVFWQVIFGTIGKAYSG